MNTKPITGTFAATGNWNVLHGMDPANGAWQIRVYDADKSVPDPDGYIKLATLSFTDLDINGDTAVIKYNSGAINEEILNPISGELRPTSFVVPIRLMTSCFNSEDARAVVTVKGGIASVSLTSGAVRHRSPMQPRLTWEQAPIRLLLPMPWVVPRLATWKFPHLRPLYSTTCKTFRYPCLLWLHRWIHPGKSQRRHGQHYLYPAARQFAFGCG